MSASAELAIVTTVVCVPIAVLGVLVVGQPAILGAGIVAVLLYGIAGFMRWMDGR